MGAVDGPPAAQRTIRLLDYDPELGATLRPERRAEARASAQATHVTIERGEHAVADLAGGRDVAYGVLLVDGLLNRTVVLDGVISAQLLGRGDLVRIGGEPSGVLVHSTVRWTVIEPLAAAVLDEAFLLTVRRWPEIVAALFERVAAQEERRDLHRALSQLPRVEDRVLAQLWLLAERWGQVTREGVMLRLHLTHELIGQLVGAKRPTVSLALKQLEAQGDIRRPPEGGWLLARRWPGEVPIDGNPGTPVVANAP
jgi:CRP/FNR family cyclic AMP-dependent transcriptional regulator